MGKKIRRVRVGWNFGCAPMRNHASNPCCRRASVELPDFLEFAEFNRLRERMGAEQLGAFEFFDPRLHLTADERMRSEEHTSELQSRGHLVCRLLLEKKKKKNRAQPQRIEEQAHQQPYRCQLS